MRAAGQPPRIAASRVDVPCHVCDEERYSVFSERGRNRVVVCRACGLYYVTPIPTAEAGAAEVTSSGKYTSDQLAKRAFFRRRAEVLLERVEQLTPVGRLLDVGCAIGTELLVARERGWSATGIELSRSSAEIARRAGLEVIERPIEAAGLSPASFDVVTANHVLEHVPRPGVMLQQIHRVLAPDALLFLSLPNVRAWWFYVKRERYGWTFQDDHFVHFSTATLGRLLERHGFALLEIGTSRWIDDHRDPAAKGRLFRALDGFVERRGLGIEIFCLARRISV